MRVWELYTKLYTLSTEFSTCFFPLLILNLSTFPPLFPHPANNRKCLSKKYKIVNITNNQIGNQHRCRYALCNGAPYPVKVGGAVAFKRPY